MNKLNPLLGFLLCLAPLAARPANSPNPTVWQFEVTVKNSLAASAKDGRLFIILAKMNDPEPRFTLDRTGLDAPQVLARDLKGFGPGAVAVADASTFAFPITNLSGVPAEDYFVQALFDSNADLRLRDVPGNLYSKPKKIYFDPAQGGDWKLKLTEQVPAERLPAETAQIKFINIQSKLLSHFYNRPIFLRAGILLPRDYDRDPSRRYPKRGQLMRLSCFLHPAAGDECLTRI